MYICEKCQSETKNLEMHKCLPFNFRKINRLALLGDVTHKLDVYKYLQTLGYNHISSCDMNKQYFSAEAQVSFLYSRNIFNGLNINKHKLADYFEYKYVVDPEFRLDYLKEVHKEKVNFEVKTKSKASNTPEKFQRNEKAFQADLYSKLAIAKMLYDYDVGYEDSHALYALLVSGEFQAQFLGLSESSSSLHNKATLFEEKYMDDIKFRFSFNDHIETMISYLSSYHY